MKTIATLAAALLMSAAAAAQSGIDAALKAVEANNSEIKAARALLDAKTMEARAANLPGATSVAYERMFGTGHGEDKTGKLTVTQEIEFPSVYAARGRANKSRREVYRMEYEETRRDILLRAKELCIDIIRLHHQDSLIRERMANIAALDEIGDKRYANGDITAIDLNKIKMQAMEARAALTVNANEMRRATSALAALNGGTMPDLATASSWLTQPPTAIAAATDEAIAADASLARTLAAHQTAAAEVRTERNKWLPSIELSYIREQTFNAANNGIEVGISIPLMSNARTVKAARASRAYAAWQAEATRAAVTEDIGRASDEAASLMRTLDSYDVTLVQDNLAMLHRALDAGQISTIDYFTEANQLYAMLETYCTLRADYEKAVARLHKHRL